MPRYTQATRPLALQTPLGPDALLLSGLTGTEALSRPFHFRLDLLALDSISFDALLGQPVSIRLSFAGCPQRHVHGILSSLEQGPRIQGPRGGVTFLRYHAEVVPRLWLLGRRFQSRVFQNLTVPEILRQVFHVDWGLDYRARLTATYPKRDFCLQYRETDLAFVSRLMEEEGICYYFQHTDSNHTLVLADGPEGHAPLSEMSKLNFEPALGGLREEARILTWRKRQELRSCKVTLRDHSFQLPQSTLDASTGVRKSVSVGTTSHSLDHGLQRGGEQLLEIYDYPGRYGRRFDGVDAEGDDQPAQIQNLFHENQRLVHLRMEEETTPALRIDGESVCSHLVPGATFELTRHFDGDGSYLLTGVEHTADLESTYLSEAGSSENPYTNRFTALPAALPFRPARSTPRPLLTGYQTATVVGPAGNDIFVDKYGRVKVKFHWDRRDGTGPECSCWLRVGQVWAGNRWGAYFWPRVGHEVIVTFEEGDPDRPIVIGSVYNENQMPPHPLPASRMLAGIKSYSATGNPGVPANPLAQYNGFVFNDMLGQEYLELHGERHIAFCSEQTHLHDVDGAHRLNVDGVHSKHIGRAPGGSGSGGGNPDPNQQYIYSDATMSGDWGAEISSVAGVSQSVFLGIYSTLTVGDYVNVVVNPLGMAADLGWLAEGPAVAVTAGIAALGALLGGVINVTMGSQLQLNYGTSMTITRGAKASISESGLWKGGSMTTGEAVLAGVTELAMGVLATAATAGAWTGCMSNYDTSQLDWEILLGASGGLTTVVGLLEVFRVTWNQVQKAKESAQAAIDTAAAAALQAQQNTDTVKNVVDLVVTLAAADWQDQNTAHYVKGSTADYNDKSRVIGGKESVTIFGGSVMNQQSVISLDDTMLQTLVGNPLTGASMMMTGTMIFVGIGAFEVGPRMTFDPDGWMIQVGPPGMAGSQISILPESITMNAGPAFLQLSAEGGITLQHAGGGIQIKDGEVSITGIKITLTGETISLVGTTISIDGAEYTNSSAVVNQS